MPDVETTRQQYPANYIEPGHGNSTAAWTGCLVILVTFLIACLGLIFAQPIIVGIGVLGVIAGVALWIGLGKAGYGEHGAKNRFNH